MPAQLIPAHKIIWLGLGSYVRGKTISEQELFGPIKLLDRALYDDGQMINSNLINHVTKERLSLIRFQQPWGELRCDSAIESVLEDIDSAIILKEEQRNAIKVFVERKMFLPSFLVGLVKV